MKSFLLTLSLSCFLVFSVSAQLANGSTAPDFTLTDINGNTHTLYDLLDAGKTVLLDFSATWCGPCWNYHTSHAMEDYYETHGPNGSNEAMVFFIESDMNTGMNDLLGLTAASQGNWIAGTPYPIIDLQTPTVRNAYNINFYPTIYKICPDKSAWVVGQAPATTLGNWIQSCTLDAELLSVSGTECYGEGQGSIDIDASGGYNSILYNWNSGQNTQDLSDIEAGTYNVTVRDLNGRFVRINDIEVDGPEMELTLSYADVEDVSCNGGSSGSIAVEATGGTDGYTYLWSNGQSEAILSDLPSGEYYLTVVDGNNCEYVESFVVSEPPVFEHDFGQSPEHCDMGDGTIDLFPTGGVLPYTIVVNGNTLPPGEYSMTGLASGQYDIELTDANGCERFEQIFIDYIEGPILIPPASPTLDCIVPTAEVSVSISNPMGSVDYYWSTTNGTILSGQFASTLVAGSAGTYFVEVYDDGSGCTSFESVSVLANQDAPQTDAGEDAAIDCDNLTITLDGTGSLVEDGFDVSWTTEDGNILEGADGLTPLVDAAGTYKLHILNPANGCLGIDEVVLADEREVPTPEITFDANNLEVLFDGGAQGEVTSWHWDFGDGNQSNEQNPTHNYQGGSTYLVCLTIETACGTNSACLEIEVSGASGILINGIISNVACNGGTDGSIDISVSGGSGNYTYEWTGPGGTVFTEEDLQSLAPGTYTIVVTDSDGNSSSISYIIGEPDLLNGITDITHVSCAGMADGNISLSIVGGVGPYAFAWSNGASTQNGGGLAGGVYSCTISDANGCVLIMDEVLVNEPAQMEYDLDVAPSNVGVSTTIGLDVAGGTQPYSFLWSNGSTTQNLTTLVAGTYTCEITDANGCLVTTEEVTIGMPLPPFERPQDWISSVAPNPVQNLLRVRFGQQQLGKGYGFRIFNSAGQIVVSKEITEDVVELNTAAWQSGMYFLEAETDFGIHFEKIIKL